VLSGVEHPVPRDKVIELKPERYVGADSLQVKAFGIMPFAQPRLDVIVIESERSAGFPVTG